MKVDIIIPNFNGSHLIKKNLPSVLESLESYHGTIIIVDDGSEKEDRENLKEVVSSYQKGEHKVGLILHTKNSGFASAVNSGVNFSDADFVVLLNSDVIPKKNFLENPIKALLSDENIFGVGCMDESIEEGRTILRGRGIAKWKRGLLIHSRGEVDSDDTFWISGGSSVIRRDLYLKVGGMDTIYNPFYWEDIDLSYRAKKAGYKIAFDSTSIVEHRHSEGAIKKHYNNYDVLKISYRNQFIFIWKNITSAQLLTSHLLNLPIHLMGAVRRGDKGFIKGLFLALAKLPDIMKKRQKQKKLYRLSDTEIIANIT